MKRDFDIVRSILLDIEERHLNPGNRFEPKVPGVDQITLDYHLRLLGEAGYVELYISASKCQTDYYVISMNYKGHDFLDSIRDNAFWKKTKKISLEKFGALSFDIIKLVAGELFKKTVMNEL